MAGEFNINYNIMRDVVQITPAKSGKSLKVINTSSGVGNVVMVQISLEDRKLTADQKLEKIKELLNG